jgi:hypothetical protein
MPHDHCRYGIVVVPRRDGAEGNGTCSRCHSRWRGRRPRRPLRPRRRGTSPRGARRRTPLSRRGAASAITPSRSPRAPRRWAWRRPTAPSWPRGRPPGRGTPRWRPSAPRMPSRSPAAAWWRPGRARWGAVHHAAPRHTAGYSVGRPIGTARKGNGT